MPAAPGRAAVTGPRGEAGRGGPLRPRRGLRELPPYKGQEERQDNAGRAGGRRGQRGAGRWRGERVTSDLSFQSEGPPLLCKGTPPKQGITPHPHPTPRLHSSMGSATPFGSSLKNPPFGGFLGGGCFLLYFFTFFFFLRQLFLPLSL